MNVVSAQGGVSDDKTLVELTDVEVASSERRDKEWKSVDQFESNDNTVSDYLNLLEHGGVYAVVADEDDTPTLRQALDSDDHESIWKPALKREMETLFDNGD